MSGIELAILGVAWVLAGASPGPATLAISGTSMGQGRAAGLALAWGVICGSALWGLMAGFGLGAVMLANAWMADVLRYVSAAYLLYLGWKSLRSALAGPMRKTGPDGDIARHFRRGLAIHLTNPKAILSWAAVFSVAVPPGAPIADLVLTGGLLMSLSVLLFTGYAILFSSPRAVRIHARAGRWIEGAFGLLFGLAGLRILTARLA